MISATSARSPVLLALFAVLGVALAVGVPAHAAGTGGIEITPVPAQRDGRPVTTFEVEVPRDGEVEVPFLISNIEDGTRSARVYSARVTESGGSFALDAPGSSPYVSMPDRDVRLEEGEVREASFTVSAGEDGVPESTEYAAVVVEVRNGAVVQRANTLIYLTAGPRVPLPLVVVGIAVLLIALAAAVLFALVARRRGPAAGAPTPA
jgi:hypothetical protein